jgi:DNA-binding NtrC family response regulator
MMTGFTSEDLVAKALSGGAMTCFSKPVSIEKNLEFLSETIPQPN